MYGLLELVGRKFGRLVVLRRDGADAQRHALWLCKCRCGELVTVRGTSLTNKVCRSCGCLSAELAAARSKARAKARRTAA